MGGLARPQNEKSHQRVWFPPITSLRGALQQSLQTSSTTCRFTACARYVDSVDVIINHLQLWKHSPGDRQNMAKGQGGLKDLSERFNWSQESQCPPTQRVGVLEMLPKQVHTLEALGVTKMCEVAEAGWGEGLGC